MVLQPVPKGSLLFSNDILGVSRTDEPQETDWDAPPPPIAVTQRSPASQPQPVQEARVVYTGRPVARSPSVSSNVGALASPTLIKSSPAVPPIRIRTNSTNTSRPTTSSSLARAVTPSGPSHRGSAAASFLYRNGAAAASSPGLTRSNTTGSASVHAAVPRGRSRVEVEVEVADAGSATPPASTSVIGPAPSILQRKMSLSVAVPPSTASLQDKPEVLRTNPNLKLVNGELRMSVFPAVKRAGTLGVGQQRVKPPVRASPEVPVVSQIVSKPVVESPPPAVADVEPERAESLSGSGSPNSGFSGSVDQESVATSWHEGSPTAQQTKAAVWRERVRIEQLERDQSKTVSPVLLTRGCITNEGNRWLQVAVLLLLRLRHPRRRRNRFPRRRRRRRLRRLPRFSSILALLIPRSHSRYVSM